MPEFWVIYKCIHCGRVWECITVNGQVPYLDRPPPSCPDCDQPIEVVEEFAAL